MSEKLKDYQVLDVFCGGTFYKVRHKVTNSIFTWKACNCSAFSDEQIQNVDNEVKTLSKVLSGNFLRYYDTILHGPTKTLYFVLEYNSWQSLQELIAQCKATDKYFTETFIWYLLLELARSCKIVEDLNFVALKKYISSDSVFVGEFGELRINCFDLAQVQEPAEPSCLIQQVGDIIRTLCYQPGACDDKIKEFRYSHDLGDVISFLTNSKNVHLRPEVIIYHPTVLANTDSLTRPRNLTDVFQSTEFSTDTNKCDSEKAVELCKTIQPLPRSSLKVEDSPVYCNITPKQYNRNVEVSESSRHSLSPTIAALALELPGFVPRSRKPYSDALEKYNSPQRISEETLSHQWMSRIFALRQREESLNRRERELIAKEIINSPGAEVVILDDSKDISHIESNGITLPPVVSHVNDEGNPWVSRRRQRRSSSVRTKPRRKSYAYEDLDSSLSADNGDGSMIVTATKFTKENMPRRNIFPEVSTKKVHFTATNPFMESDESVTLTFYDLENVDSDGYQVPRKEEKVLKDINKFKYLDLEKITSEKRAAKQWNHSSPSKQAKVTGKAFYDITNHMLKKTPSKTSISSKCSNGSKSSFASSKSQWNMESAKVSDKTESDKIHSSCKLLTQTPKAPPELKKTKSRKSLLPFKTPFKFKTSTKV